MKSYIICSKHNESKLEINNLKVKKNSQSWEIKWYISKQPMSQRRNHNGI